MQKIKKNQNDISQTFLNSKPLNIPPDERYTENVRQELIDSVCSAFDFLVHEVWLKQMVRWRYM